MQEDFIEDIIEDDALLDDVDTGERFEHHRFIADKGQGLLRVDKFITSRIDGISRNRIQQAADANCVLVNDVAVKSNYRIKPNDVVSIVMDRPRREVEIIPEDLDLDVVYEDEDVMVVNKRPGLVVHPGHGNYTGTLVNGIAYLLKDSEVYDAKDPRLGLVHRIDKDTSGLLVIAKNEHSKTHLCAQFFEKTTKREYVAIVWGGVTEDTGRIEGNIGRSVRDRLQMCVFEDETLGKPAVTHYEVIERMGYVSMVKCRLETGRTHQIRVHMKHIGHTLFNDARYGGDQILKGTTFTKYKQFVQNCFDICPRQALHARMLGFVHPRTGEELIFEAPMPEDMLQVADKWRNYISGRGL